MAKTNNYSIAYQEIGPGEHIFKFDLSSKFFTSKDHSDILDGNCNVVLQVEKTNNTLTFYIGIDGEVKVSCDRCLDEFLMPISFDGVLIVKFSSERTSGEIDDEGAMLVGGDGEVTADVYWQNPADDQIDLEQYLYESICLNLPYQKVHPVDARGILMCNEEMLSRFVISDSEEEF